MGGFWGGSWPRAAAAAAAVARPVAGRPAAASAAAAVAKVAAAAASARAVAPLRLTGGRLRGGGGEGAAYQWERPGCVFMLRFSGLYGTPSAAEDLHAHARAAVRWWILGEGPQRWSWGRS